MVDYSIYFEGQSENFTKVHYSLNGKEKKDIFVKIYNKYLNHLEYGSELTIEPGISYYSYFPSSLSDRCVNFYDKNTLELVSSFGLKGSKDMIVCDYNGFVKQIMPLLTTGQKHNIYTVFNEICTNNLYHNDFITVKEGDVVVDIGFNFGIFTYHSLTLNPSKIYGVEPNIYVSNYFKRVINDERVKIYDFAMGDFDGEIEFFENEDTGMSTIYNDLNSLGKKTSYNVPIMTLRTLVEKEQIDSIDYLKVDCEGAEFSIFESIDEEFLKNKIQKIAIEYHKIPSDSKVQSLISKLQQNGFDVRIHGQENNPLGMIYAKKL
jgi:FkbM family methyltransferase